MTSDAEYKLNHREFVVLGLVAEFPSHPYSMNQRIDERGMREWTKIGKSSIYNDLNNLDEHGLVESYREEVDNRVRRIYRITDFGFDILKSKIYQVLKEFVGRNDENFYVAFSMLPLLSQEQQVEAVSYSLSKIKKYKEELNNMLVNNLNYPLNVKGLFIHPIKILETDVEFLEWVLEELKEVK